MRLRSYSGSGASSPTTPAIFTHHSPYNCSFPPYNKIAIMPVPTLPAEIITTILSEAIKDTQRKNQLAAHQADFGAFNDTERILALSKMKLGLAAKNFLALVPAAFAFCSFVLPPAAALSSVFPTVSATIFLPPLSSRRTQRRSNYRSRWPVRGIGGYCLRCQIHCCQLP